MGTRISDKVRKKQGVLAPEVEEAGPPVNAAPQPISQQVRAGQLPLTPAPEQPTYYQLQEADLNTSRLMKSMYGKEVPNDPTQAIQYVLQLPLGLAPERGDYYSKKAEELEKRRAKAQELFDKKADWNGWLSIAETIGQGLVQLGAAKAGQKYGFDSTQVKISPIDWDKKYNNMLKELDVQLKSADRQLEAVAKDKTAEEQQYEQIRRDVAGNILKSAFISEQERLKEKRAKEGERKEATQKAEKTVEDYINEQANALSKRVATIRGGRAELETALGEKNSPLNKRVDTLAKILNKMSSDGAITKAEQAAITANYKKTEDVADVISILDKNPYMNSAESVSPEDKQLMILYRKGLLPDDELLRKAKQKWQKRYNIFFGPE